MARTYDHLRVDAADGVVTVTLDRPSINNAFNARLIAEVTTAFETLGQDDNVRVIVLAGAGKHFCAGADLEWMRTQSGYGEEKSFQETLEAARMFHAIDHCPRPVIARVHGAAIGGGMGLVAAADIAVAGSEGARFGLSEVRLGLVPGVISPFVVAKVGVAVARELMLTGERFGAAKARAIGLINHVVPDDRLDEAVNERVGYLLAGAPGALAACKELIRAVAHKPTADVLETSARFIAQRRVSDEGREGIAAFLEKRNPVWKQGG